MQTMDEIDRSFSAGYEQGAKDYKEQRDLVLQENAELVEKIEQLEEAVGRMAIELATVKKERDAVKVVRCGECLFWEKRPKETYFALCDMFETAMGKDGFCSYGERKNDD